MMGPMIVPMPNTAMACPWRCGGLICKSVAWDSGISPAPATPCRARKNTSSPRLPAAPQSAEASVKPMTETRKIYLLPNRPASQPVSGIIIAAHTMVRGQCPGDLVERGRQAALNVRQGNVEDCVVDALHNVRQHDRQCDHAAVRDRGERVAPHVSPLNHPLVRWLSA